jgi:hypothetical protein
MLQKRGLVNLELGYAFSSKRDHQLYLMLALVVAGPNYESLRVSSGHARFVPQLRYDVQVLLVNFVLYTLHCASL